MRLLTAFLGDGWLLLTAFLGDGWLLLTAFGYAAEY
jgi:hypothetical protein